jgi:hypothetical protein
MQEVVYVGLRWGGIARVHRLAVGERDVGLLPVRLDLRNHSPDGLEWGYSGSGPAQLALALLVDAIVDVALSLAIYQEYKRGVVAGLPRAGWSLTRSEVLFWVSANKTAAVLEQAESIRRERVPNAEEQVDQSAPSAARAHTEGG